VRSIQKIGFELLVITEPVRFRNWSFRAIGEGFLPDDLRSSTCECATALPNALTAISDNPIANLIKRVVLSCMTIFHNLVAPHYGKHVPRNVIGVTPPIQVSRRSEAQTD
jgi:hypothetical protein